jgi:hypothetical protein
MTITGVQISEYCAEQTTVEVTAVDAKGHEEIFAVQTVDSMYRPDLGCWITTPISNGPIDYDDFDTFDIKEIVSVAERFIQSATEEKRTEYKDENGESVYIIITGRKSKVVIENSQFLNSVTSSYQREYSESVADFETETEALEYCADNF